MPTLTMDSNIVLKILAIQNDFEVEASLDVEKDFLGAIYITFLKWLYTCGFTVSNS